MSFYKNTEQNISLLFMKPIQKLNGYDQTKTTNVSKIHYLNEFVSLLIANASSFGSSQRRNVSQQQQSPTLSDKDKAARGTYIIENRKRNTSEITAAHYEINVMHAYEYVIYLTCQIVVINIRELNPKIGETEPHRLRRHCK